MIIDKKQGLSVHAGNDENEETLIDIIRKETKSSFPPSLCHRIDRNTSGIVIIAKNSSSLKEMLHAIKEKQVVKSYYAIVNGCSKEKNATLTNFLSKNEKIGKVFIHEKKEPGDLTAITHYKVLKTNGNISLLDIKLETGRMHQIRAQLAHVNLPIIGDGKYGNTVINRKYKVKKHMLYAYKVKFSFPHNSNLKYLDNQTFEINCGIEKIFDEMI